MKPTNSQKEPKCYNKKGNREPFCFDNKLKEAAKECAETTYLEGKSETNNDYDKGFEDCENMWRKKCEKEIQEAQRS